TDPVTKIFSADGRQVHRGAEFSFAGKVSERLTLLGGFSVLDAKLTKTTNAALQGKTPQAVPEKLLRLYAEYALPAIPGLVLTGGVSHTGAMWADDLNTLSYPGVTTGDVGMRYVSSVAGHKTTWRVTVSNVTGKDYWTSNGGSMLYLGSPRTLAASASFEF
ncbi:MAG TPA: TonB-dependent receptor, partial [Rhodocyclaceae bacterium]|nr:TonB-dependent receptor [Rhodocyclaceae bacterium]